MRMHCARTPCRAARPGAVVLGWDGRRGRLAGGAAWLLDCMQIYVVVIVVIVDIAVVVGVVVVVVVIIFVLVNFVCCWLHGNKISKKMLLLLELYF